MFDKMLSRVGIGSARVDTILHNFEVARGDMLKGEIRMYGGKAPQVINKFDLELVTTYQQELKPGASGYKLSLRHHSLAEHFTLGAGEEKVLNFELLVPIATPISLGSTKSWIDTLVDVNWALDPKDNDPITILPDPATAHVLAALLELGYAHTEQSGVYLAMSGEYDMPFMQAFEFKATKPVPGMPAELSLLIQANSYDAEIHLELDPIDEMEDGIREGRMVRLRLRQDADFTSETLKKMLEKSEQ
ncbi:MAG: sporulation protein [Candidatus Sericytochromatia bacterium]